MQDQPLLHRGLGLALWLRRHQLADLLGFDGWRRLTIAVRCVAQAERPIGRDHKPGQGVTYTRAFRKRFQVPEAAATIADRINQKCHHDWIETFLVSHREVRSVDQHQASSD